jgi:hypothetical protein
MSFNRLRYDQCAYQKDLSQSTSSLNYTLDPNKFYNCNDCRVEFGLVGGNNVSITNSNMVDLESDLFNITRQNSTCPERKYLPFCEGCEENGGIPCGSASCKRREQLTELNACNMIQYTPRIDHVGFDLRYPGCPIQNNQSIDGQSMKYPPQLNPVQWNGQKEVAQWKQPTANRDPSVPAMVARQ